MAGAWAWAGQWRLLQGLPPGSETGRGVPRSHQRGSPASSLASLLGLGGPGVPSSGTSRLWGRPVTRGGGSTGGEPLCGPGPSSVRDSRTDVLLLRHQQE